MSEKLNSLNITFDLHGPSEKLDHFWEHTVGSGHATLALRADYQAQLARCHRELGFRHVRFHGLLDDDMGTLMRENDELVYSFFNADQICDFLLSIGMRPFMELSFMPSTLSSGDDIVFHYKGNITPPRDYGAWQTLISKLVTHWRERYGATEVAQWFFEIWNEPNLSAFWTGGQANYFKLYKYSAEAIKKVDVNLKVGGPATSQNAWIEEFLTFCEKNAAPVDFVSTHHYPTDGFGKPGDDTVGQLAASRRSVLRDEAIEAKGKARGKPLYYTEWSTSSNPFDEMHDLPYASAYIVKTVLEARGHVQGYSYWTFSDIFEENYFSSMPFHGGFGLMNIYGIPKPAYRAYELLHRLGDTLYEPTGQTQAQATGLTAAQPGGKTPGPQTEQTIDCWLTKAENKVSIMLTNSALPRHPVKTESIEIKIGNIGAVQSAFIERIDDENANATAAWNKMGKPESLTPQAVNALELASSLAKQPLRFSFENGTVSLSNIVMPPQGTACITLEVSAK